MINACPPQRVQETVAALRTELPGADVRGVAADVADADGAAALLAEVPRVDVLVGTLGFFGARPVVEVDDTGVPVNAVLAGPAHTGGVDVIVP